MQKVSQICSTLTEDVHNIVDHLIYKNRTTKDKKVCHNHMHIVNSHHIYYMLNGLCTVFCLYKKVRPFPFVASSHTFALPMCHAHANYTNQHIYIRYHIVTKHKQTPTHTHTATQVCSHMCSSDEPPSQAKCYIKMRCSVRLV